MSENFAGLFKQEYIHVFGDDATQSAVFQNAADAFMKNGLVDKEYCQKLLEREKEYPTGLALPLCNVAIPHVDNEMVHGSAIYVSVLPDSCKWRNMEDCDEEIGVSVVFNICLANKEDQVGILSEIVELVQKQDVMDLIRKTSSEKEIYELIRKEVTK